MSASIVICGLVRTPDLLLKSINDFMVLKKQNLIEQIVFSTWVGEIDQYQDLRQRLNQYGIMLLEASPPKLSGPGHIWHQMKSLDFGLRQLANDSYVLKTRADLYIRPEFIKMLVTNNCYLRITDQETIFDKRIWIPWFEISKPFYMADECFFGSCKDLKNLVNYDASYDVLYNIDCGITHIRRFINPFLKYYPILNEYLQFGAQTGHFSTKRFAILDYDLRSDIFLEYLATYYLILEKYFRIHTPASQIHFRDHSDPKVTIDNDQFDLNFRVEKSWIPKGGHIYAYNESWLYSLLNEKNNKGTLVTKFYRALSRIRNGELSLDSEIRNELLEEYKRYKNVMLSQIPRPELSLQDDSISSCLMTVIKRIVKSSRILRAI